MLPASAAFTGMEALVHELQTRITDRLGAVEGRPFAVQEWARPAPADAAGPAGVLGGGRMATLRGEVVEKGAVLASSVWGTTNPLTGNPFRACGLSVIVHPRSPHAATAHMNVRRFEEYAAGADAPTQAWFGGGADLTPMGVHHAEDAARFHDVLRERLGARYEEGKAEADRYFFVPHRGRPRGAGGVFYDHLDGGPEGLAFVRAIGEAFLEAYAPLLALRGREPWTEAERAKQLAERGVYVEFNLLYDRGTRFGFQSGGNPDAILQSLPPAVTW